MDNFDTKVSELKNLGTRDKMKKVQMYLDKCRCPPCPSYTECSKNDNEGIFCLMGNSFRCINEIKGCNCPTCPVEHELSMKDNMYCMKGSEFENRYLDNLR